jgi:hypothetical protein
MTWLAQSGDLAVRGRPERSSSNSPATPWASYRARQLITVWRDTDNRRAISA